MRRKVITWFAVSFYLYIIVLTIVGSLEIHARLVHIILRSLFS